MLYRWWSEWYTSPKRHMLYCWKMRVNYYLVQLLGIRLIHIILKCVSLVWLLDYEQIVQVFVKIMELQIKLKYIAAFLKWRSFTAPALTSCQYQHFSGCNSFTVIILRLARQNAPKTLKT